jgi:cation diffusion facilitator CzcD-associated flavoprotein CzcO
MVAMSFAELTAMYDTLIIGAGMSDFAAGIRFATTTSRRCACWSATPRSAD